MQPYRIWYGVLALLALAPVGLRMWSWRTTHEPIDPAMAEAGKMLFKHEWKANDPLSPGGDGLGPVFNASSCLACHGQGGAGGGGGLKFNVPTFTDRRPGPTAREGVIHAAAVDPRFKESLKNIDKQMLDTAQPSLAALVRLSAQAVLHCGGPARDPINAPPGVHVSQRNTPALFGDKLIDEIPDNVIIAGARLQALAHGLARSENENVPVGRAMILANNKVGHFGWKAQTARLGDFVQAACANELGLSNPGQEQPRPMGSPGYRSPGYDLSNEQCNELTAFVASLPRPIEKLPTDLAGREKAQAGKQLFTTIGCAACHTPKLGDVDGLYSDLLLHRMGQPLEGGGSYGEPPLPKPEVPSGDGPLPDEWRTPPLWGVADSAPYMHDGRAVTLQEAIHLHGGQATRAKQSFEQLPPAEQTKLLTFLKSLRAPGL